jgi:sporulation protein YlmC with PRC-barrel domain
MESRIFFTALLLVASLVALSAHAEPADMLASEVIGKPVRTPQGKALGEIAGLLLHTRPNGVHYAQLAYRDAAGEEKRFAYPLNAFRRAGEALVLNVPPTHLEKSDERRLESDERYVAATAVLGRGVDDRLGNTIGRLDDVLVNLESGRTRSFLITFADQPGATLPLSAHLVRLQAEGNLILHADPDRRAALG